MQVSPHLNFNGQCRAAFEYYALCLGGKVTFLLTWGDSPMAGEMPPSMHARVCHATFQMGDGTFSGSDGLPEQFQKPQGFALTINPTSVEEAERIFAAMSAGGTVQMPLQETFWAQRFGELVDQFGIPWLINCEKTA
jgi:PhnB protein